MSDYYHYSASMDGYMIVVPEASHTREEYATYDVYADWFHNGFCGSESLLLDYPHSFSPSQCPLDTHVNIEGGDSTTNRSGKATPVDVEAQNGDIPAETIAVGGAEPCGSVCGRHDRGFQFASP
jgi:hypothetical protein